jgi:transcriptional regulator with XRE-family HTH domain
MSKGTEIGLRVRKARISIGLSLTSLAKHAGMSLAYVSLLEAGKIPAPTVRRLSRIASVLKTPLESIITESEFSPAQRLEQHTDIVKELISIAPESEPEIVRTFVEGLLHLCREDQTRVAALILRLRIQREGGHTKEHRDHQIC